MLKTKTEKKKKYDYKALLMIKAGAGTKLRIVEQYLFKTNIIYKENGTRTLFSSVQPIHSTGEKRI